VPSGVLLHATATGQADTVPLPVLLLLLLLLRRLIDGVADAPLRLLLVGARHAAGRPPPNVVAALVTMPPPLRLTRSDAAVVADAAPPVRLAPHLAGADGAIEVVGDGVPTPLIRRAGGVDRLAVLGVLDAAAAAADRARGAGVALAGWVGRGVAAVAAVGSWGSTPPAAGAAAAWRDASVAIVSACCGS